MLSLSASKVDCYYNCPKLYYFRYISIPKKVEDNKYFAIGNIVHKILEDYHKNLIINEFDRKKTVTELIKQLKNDTFLKKQLRNKIIQKNDIKSIGEMFKNYISYYKHTAKDQLIEKFFKIDMKDFIITGRADRVDLFDTHANIIDYKTSGKIFTQEEVFKSVQLPTYRIWIDHEYPNIYKKITGEYIFMLHLIKSPSIKFTIDQYLVEECIDKYKNVAKCIENKDFPKNKSFKYCGKWCEYKNECELEM